MKRERDIKNEEWREIKNEGGERERMKRERENEEGEKDKE
jgi:hypothetical protein